MTTSEGKNKLIDLEAIKSLLAEKNISQAEIGRRIGLLNRELMSRRLQNKYAISGDELLKIADELEVSVEDLRLAA